MKQDRRLLRRSGQDGCDAWSAAKAFNFRSVSIETGIYWQALRWTRFLARLGKALAAAARPAPDRAEIPRSVLVLVVVIVAIVIRLIGGVVRLVALIVPELSIHAIGGEQLGVRTALDRLAA